VYGFSTLRPLWKIFLYVSAGSFRATKVKCATRQFLLFHPPFYFPTCKWREFYLNCLALVFFSFSISADVTGNAKGFECRGTTLSRRAVAWENLLRASQPAGPLSTNPLESTVAAAGTSAVSSLKSNDTPRKKKKKQK
jgi:hypothetical protein